MSCENRDLRATGSKRLFETLGLCAQFFASQASDFSLEDCGEVGHERILPAPCASAAVDSLATGCDTRWQKQGEES